MGADGCIHGDKPVGVVDVAGGASKVKLISTISRKKTPNNQHLNVTLIFSFVL